jgi:hypothetical protein
MLALRRRRPDLSSPRLAAIMVAVTLATATVMVILATALDAGLLVAAIPVGALARFITELWHATGDGRTTRSR